MLVPLGLLPALAAALTAYALRPARPVPAPVRLALVRAAVLVAGIAAIAVEVLSAFRALTPPVIAVAWSIALAVGVAAAAIRYRRDGRPPARALGRALRDRARAGWTSANRAERALFLGLATLLLLELLVALVAPPNNFDSQVYHLPKIEHWVVQRDVQFFATRIHRQVTLAPGAEYLLLHLRLLTGGDALYNLLQWSAGLGCVLMGSRLVGQLGGGRRAQLLAGFVVGTTPLVVLESTSTQTDLVVAAWVLALATLVLDEMRRRTGPGALVLLGLATGLAALTKSTGLFAGGPLLLLWGLAQLRLAARPVPAPQPVPAGRGLIRGVPITAGSSLLILAIAAAVTGPYMARMNQTYGNPLGPAYLRDSIAMQRHDPPSILINALRVGQTALDTPIPPLNRAAARAVTGVAHLVHVDPSDQRITFWGSTYPVVAWPPNEDKASFPIEGLLVLFGAVVAVVRPGRLTGSGPGGPGRPADAPTHAVIRAFAVVFWVSLLLYTIMIKWQPWGNRLILFVLALGAPLAGLWLDRLLSGFHVRAAERSRTPDAEPGGKPVCGAAGPTAGTAARPAAWPVAAWVATVALVISGVAGVLAIGYGYPRRLVGPNSIFTLSHEQERFVWRPEWESAYEWAADGVRASGAHRIGLAQGDNTWEYPWWTLLRGDDIQALQTLIPGHPAATRADVDAILCVVPAAVCGYYAQPGWHVHMRGDIGYAVPPDRDHLQH